MEAMDEAEIWAPIVAAPLNLPASSHTIPLPSQVEEYFNYVYNNYAKETDQFIGEPQDKPWKDQHLGEFIAKKNWRRGPRGSRKRRIFPSAQRHMGLVRDFVHAFCAYFDPLTIDGEKGSINFYVLQNRPYLANLPSESRGGRWQCRKNNDHWTEKEVIKLVEGVETYGVGLWTKVKNHYFSTSVRDPTHLKDKWRNLKRACGILCNSKRKEKSQKKMYRPLSTRLMQRIKRLSYKLSIHIKNKKNSRENNN